ncbi:MAG: hypothetical protein V4751_13185 [Pseudomonadota bacterium]
MKAVTLGAVALAFAGFAVAAYEYIAVQDLRAQLQQTHAQRETLRAQVEEQIAANTALQNTFEGQIASLQDNLQSGSRQLALLSASLQEAREMLNPGTAIPAPSDAVTPPASP